MPKVPKKKPVNRRKRYRPATFSGRRWHPLKERDMRDGGRRAK